MPLAEGRHTGAAAHASGRAVDIRQVDQRNHAITFQQRALGGEESFRGVGAAGIGQT